MALKILSVLGTGRYESRTHSYNSNHLIETPFIQEAVLNLFEENLNSDFGGFYIFLTEKAKEIHFKDLESRIMNRYPQISINPVDIKDGKTKEEIWEIFDSIYNQIEENDEIILDITHSFRHIPMQLLVVINYAKVLKNVKLKGIYYGAFEASYKESEKEIIPIFDISDFSSLLEWSYSANTFINYGNVKPIQESYKNLQRIKGKEWNIENKNFSKFIESLVDFSNCIYTARGTSMAALINENGALVKNSNKKSIQASYNSLLSNYENLLEEERLELKQIKPIVEKVKESIEAFCEESSLKTGLAAIKWSIEKNLIQQAYTIFSETIKTYVCNIYELDEMDYINRELIVGKVLNILGRKIPKDQWKVEESHIETIEKIMNTIDEKIYKIYDKVGTRRNDINHFGLTKEKISYEDLIKDLNKLFEEFTNIVNSDSSI